MSVRSKESKTDAQFKRLREQSKAHLIRVIINHLTGQLPTLPPDFWPWAEAVIWRDYTPAQKATLIETDYAIDLAHATSHYTPFNVTFELDIFTFSCSAPLPPIPASLPVPLLSRDNHARVQQRGPGHYASTFSQNDFWFDITKQFDLPPSERSHDLPPAMQTWLAAVKALDEPARSYNRAINLVDSIWRQVRTWTAWTDRPISCISCNALMLTVPEWVPMRMLPANRRTALPAATRLRAETAIESILKNEPGHVYTEDFDKQQPLLPQLRQLLLPPITAYRLAGKDTGKDLR